MRLQHALDVDLRVVEEPVRGLHGRCVEGLRKRAVRGLRYFSGQHRQALCGPGIPEVGLSKFVICPIVALPSGRQFHPPLVTCPHTKLTSSDTAYNPLQACAGLRCGVVGKPQTWSEANEGK